MRNPPASSHSPLLGLILFALLVGCDEAPPRSVLLITIDTLRADHLSTYGYDVDTSPNITALAERGRVYAHAFSASSSTAPSHASILTGLYPSWHTVGSVNGTQPLHESAVTLAEIFAEAGYSTGAIISNPLLGRSIGLSQGFEHYDDQLESTETNRELKERYADRAVDLSLAWLDSIGDSEFFLWVHLQDPHGPYLPPEHHACPQESSDAEVGPTLEAGYDHSGHESIPRYQLHADEREFAQYRRRYDCEISFMDQELGRLLAWVKAQEPGREILVALTSDHGEAMGEDGFYFAHNHSLGLDQVHVPLVLAGPGIAAGDTTGTPVTNITLFETLLEFGGLPSPVDGAPTSLLQPSDPNSSTFYMECLNQVAIVHENTFVRRDLRTKRDLKFWQNGNPNTGSFWMPLGEEVVAPLNPRLGRNKGAVDAARELLGRFANRAARSRETLEDLIQGAELSPEQIEALKSLGYIE